MDHLRDRVQDHYGVIQQTLFYSPIYAADDVDSSDICSGRELSPFYVY